MARGDQLGRQWRIIQILISSRIWHESQEIHPQADGSIIFEVEAGGTEEIKYWVMSWGARARILFVVVRPQANNSRFS